MVASRLPKLLLKVKVGRDIGVIMR